MNKYEEALESARETNWHNIWHLDRVVSEQMDIYLDVFEELVEKETPNKPHLEGDGYSDGELVYDIWVCPNCEKHYELDYDKYDYCPNCGQHIDWKYIEELEDE